MPRSPIELMIDQATGYTPGQRKVITLRCPHCKRTKGALKDKTDPEGTSVVEALCDQCDSGGNKPEVHYYDEEGRWFDGEKFIPLKTS